MTFTITNGLTNWKSNLAAIVVSIASFVMFKPDLFVKWPWVSPAAAFILSGGLAAFGISKNAESQAAHEAALAKQDAALAKQDVTIEKIQETHAQATAAAGVAADTQAQMANLERNTNGKFDKLLQVKGEAEFAKGLKQGEDNPKQ